MSGIKRKQIGDSGILPSKKVKQIKKIFPSAFYYELLYHKGRTYIDSLIVKNCCNQICKFIPNIIILLIMKYIMSTITATIYNKDTSKMIERVNNVKQFIINQGSIFVLKYNNKLAVRGLNYCGQLGLSNRNTIDRFTINNFFGNNVIKKISNGLHTFVLTKSNGVQKIFAMGLNFSGPIEIKTNVIIKDISTGEQHSLFLDDENKVYSIGANAHGQLGLGHTKCVDQITHIEVGSNNVKINCSAYASYILMTNGNCFSCGSNQLGQCAQPNDNVIIRDLQRIDYFVNNNIKINNIKTGDYHICFINNESKMYFCGSNVYNQLSGITEMLKVHRPMQFENFKCDNAYLIQVFIHENSSILVSNYLNVYYFGYNYDCLIFDQCYSFEMLSNEIPNENIILDIIPNGQNIILLSYM